MIVCDVCERKVVGFETEVQIVAGGTSPGLPLKIHLCNGHLAQLESGVKLVLSLLRSSGTKEDDPRCKEWLSRLLPWTFDEKGQRVMRVKDD